MKVCADMAPQQLFGSPACIAGACRGSPLSQKLALREVREGARKDLASCLCTEFRLAAHILRQKSDFSAGVTALLIDKSGPAKWQPPTLEEVKAPCKLATSVACSGTCSCLAVVYTCVDLSSPGSAGLSTACGLVLCTAAG